MSTINNGALVNTNPYPDKKNAGMSYTPLQPNQTATFGTSGDAVKKLQTDLNTKNAGNPNYKPLVVDGLYGKLTQGATTFGVPQKGIVSSTDVMRDAKINSAALTKALQQSGVEDTVNNPDGNPNDPAMKKEKEVNMSTYSDSFTKALDDMAARSNDSTKRLISTIQAQKANKVNEATQSYDNYKRGLQLLGVQHNKAQATPELLLGEQMQATQIKENKISELDAEENKALMDAENARAENDFKILKEKMDYVKEIKKEKANALKELHDSLVQKKEIAEIEAQQIYDTMDTLGDADKEAFLLAVSKKYGIPVNQLVTSLSNEKINREKKKLEMDKLRKGDPGKDISYTERKAMEQQQVVSEISGAFSSGKKIQGTQIPYLAPSGYATYDGWKSAIKAAQPYMDRKAFIQQFGYLMNPDASQKDYGVTDAEYKLITGVSPTGL